LQRAEASDLGESTILLGRRLIGLLFVFAILFAGCGSDSDTGADAIRPKVSHRAWPLTAAPGGLLASCTRSRLLRPACPRRLLAADRYTSSFCPAGKRGCLFREGIDMFTVESRRRRDRNMRRPAFVHLVVYAGDLGGPKGFQRHARSAFPFDWPSLASARALVDGLSPHKGTEAIAFGHRRFGEVEGELVLAPEIQAMDGGHLIFRWRSGRVEYAISLHAWEPLTEAAATLRALVAAVPAAHR